MNEAQEIVDIMDALSGNCHIKLNLGGESPWGEVITDLEDGGKRVRIDNHLICTDVHGYKFNDVIDVYPHIKYTTVWVPEELVNVID